MIVFLIDALKSCFGNLAQQTENSSKRKKFQEGRATNVFEQNCF